MLKRRHKYGWILYSKPIPQHQGLGLLARTLDQAGLVKHIGWETTAFNKLWYRLAVKLRPRIGGDRENAYQTFVANWLAFRNGERGRIAHLAWGDQYLLSVKRPERHVFTVHLPFEKWSADDWKAILAARGIITMAERERVEIVRRSPTGRVACILHGVDLDFWRPAPPDPTSSPIICVAGRFMRNYDMIVRVVIAVLRRRADVRFRWLVNPDFVMPAEIARQIPASRIELVRNLSIQELRRFYQQSTLFFTPYDSVTASNSIVEALACGLPIVTTRVGGMASYGGEETLIMVNNNDDQAAVAALETCLNDVAWRKERGARARQFAESSLAWSEVAEQHRHFYENLEVV